MTQVTKKFGPLCCHPLVNCCSIVHTHRAHCLVLLNAGDYCTCTHLSSKNSIASHQTFQGQNRVWRGGKRAAVAGLWLLWRTQDSSHNFSEILIHMFLCFIVVYEISYSAVIYILQYIVHHCSGFTFGLPGSGSVIIVTFSVPFPGPPVFQHYYTIRLIWRSVTVSTPVLSLGHQ